MMTTWFLFICIKTGTYIVVNLPNQTEKNVEIKYIGNLRTQWPSIYLFYIGSPIYLK